MGFFDLMGFVWILIHCLDGFHVFCFSLWEMDDDLRKSRNDGLCFVFFDVGNVLFFFNGKWMMSVPVSSGFP